MNTEKKVSTPKGAEVKQPRKRNANKEVREAIANIDSRKALIDTNFKAKSGYIPNATVQLLTTDKAYLLPQQAQCFIQTLASIDGHSCTIEELCGGDVAGESLVYKHSNFKTVQTASRVFNHYRERLVKEGFITVS